MKLKLNKKKLKNLSLDSKVILLEQTKDIAGGKTTVGNNGNDGKIIGTNKTWQRVTTGTCW